jgi:cyclopropane-fatty-acyl-phospholipid synthase
MLPFASGGEILLCLLVRKIIRTGRLDVQMPSGREHVFGEGPPLIALRIATIATVWRLLRNPELALGEAFMDGTLTVERGSIYDLLELVMANLKMSSGPGPIRLQAQFRKLLRRIVQHNPVVRSQTNVAHHYDLSDKLYDLFLDASRLQYSCAYYTAPTDTLEQAQAHKLRHIAAKLLLQPGQKVLDIGSGWGGLGLHLAQTAGVDVTGLTLSSEQLGYAVKAAASAGLQDRAAYHLRDYRHETGRYDRIVSVGMFEHVGIGHYREYFDKVADLLTDEGVALVHTIGAARGPTSANPWLHKYIFPGGYAPALSEVMPAIERAGLYITDVEVLRLHYARTLRAWRDRFMAERPRIVELYDERFCRMWEFYLAFCEAGFRHSGLVVFQIQISKRIDAVPITRDYIAVSEQGMPS